MATSAFAIVLTERNHKVAARIEAEFEDAFEYTDTCWLVRCKARTLSQDVAVAAGIKGENRVLEASGVVFRLGTGYSGYTNRALWEWLDSNEED